MKKITIWIFCKIIDNFGDAGICLRLAKLLSKEYNFEVIIWIDNLNILHKMQNNIDPKKDYQYHNKIKFLNSKNFNKIYNLVKIPNCIIEILESNIPNKVIKIIENNKILWINLEYLSAEKWVENYHLVASIKPNNVKKYFYFQGFKKKSGGLIREKNYDLQKQNFYKNKNIGNYFLKKNNIYYEKDKIKIFIFAYSNLIWEKTIQTLKLINKKIIIWIANPKLLDNLNNKLLNYDEKNNIYIYDNIIIQKVKFVEQKYFDYYLWLCDIAIIRGEDSFIRAQFISKIFLWNIYFQENKIHILKLNAFLNILKKYIPDNIFKSIYALSMEINDPDFKLNLEDRLQNWQNLIYNIQKSNFKNWSNFLMKQKTAIEKLILFIKKNLEY